MLVTAFAFDYDGTLAHDGVVAEATVRALKRLKASGRKLVMVTGRELPDLRRVFWRLAMFDAIVAENGALLEAGGIRRSRSAAARSGFVMVGAWRLTVAPTLAR